MLNLTGPKYWAQPYFIVPKKIFSSEIFNYSNEYLSELPRKYLTKGRVKKTFQGGGGSLYEGLI